MRTAHSPRASGLRSNKFPLRELRIIFLSYRKFIHFNTSQQHGISYKIKITALALPGLPRKDIIYLS